MNEGKRALVLVVTVVGLAIIVFLSKVAQVGNSDDTRNEPAAPSARELYMSCVREQCAALHKTDPAKGARCVTWCYQKSLEVAGGPSVQKQKLSQAANDACYQSRCAMLACRGGELGFRENLRTQAEREAKDACDACIAQCNAEYPMP